MNNDNTPVYNQIALRIVEAQESIIGPIALERAQHVAGLRLDPSTSTVAIVGDPAIVIDELIGQYKEIFGQISVDVCRDATSKLVVKLPQELIPSLLR